MANQWLFGRREFEMLEVLFSAVAVGQTTLDLLELLSV